jgi:hypothetical protein
LFCFDRFEESLEIARPKAIVVVSLNDLDEERGPILNGPCEYLQQIAIVVIVNKDVVLL